MYENIYECVCGREGGREGERETLLYINMETKFIKHHNNIDGCAP